MHGFSEKITIITCSIMSEYLTWILKIQNILNSVDLNAFLKWLVNVNHFYTYCVELHIDMFTHTKSLNEYFISCLLTVNKGVQNWIKPIFVCVMKIIHRPLHVLSAHVNIYHFGNVIEIFTFKELFLQM